MGSIFKESIILTGKNGFSVLKQSHVLVLFELTYF